MFTVQYGLNPYIKPIRFVFKGLMYLMYFLFFVQPTFICFFYPSFLQYVKFYSLPL